MAACVGLMLAVQAGAQVPHPVAGAQTEARERQIRPGTASRGHDGDIYGYQLMTERERSEFRERLRAATSDEEVRRIRKEHHEQIQVRAKERGVTLSGPRDGGGSIQWTGPSIVDGGKK